MISKNSLKEQSNGFLVDDKCLFGAEVFVIESQQRVVECVSVLKVPIPFKRDWKIENFSKLKDVWTSEEFTAGDHKWKIDLYPDGNTKEKGRSVSIFLYCVDSNSFAANEKVRADYCIQIKNSLHSTDNSAKRVKTTHSGTSPPAASHSNKYSSWFTLSATTWGWPAFISIADMRDPCKGFIVDDCCFLQIEISVRAVVRNAPSNSN
ncbi:hypothetical protein DH2020_049491 [Rehmannia glutinosa]|uniref:MATH domain-containing protein n=1 Tax=Rehmannia glutinosa TaxID=99300 RepID=A0ABR0U2N6_REHGL